MSLALLMTNRVMQHVQLDHLYVTIVFFHTFSPSVVVFLYLISPSLTHQHPPIICSCSAFRHSCLPSFSQRSVFPSLVVVIEAALTKRQRIKPISSCPLPPSSASLPLHSLPPSLSSCFFSLHFLSFLLPFHFVICHPVFILNVFIVPSFSVFMCVPFQICL